MFQEVIDRPLIKAPVHGRTLMIEWLKTKPADEAYDWRNPNACLMTQFISETGATGAQIMQIGETAYIAQGPKPTSIDDFHRRERHWTFGQALARARDNSG